MKLLEEYLSVIYFYMMLASLAFGGSGDAMLERTKFVGIIKDQLACERRKRVCNGRLPAPELFLFPCYVLIA